MTSTAIAPIEANSLAELERLASILVKSGLVPKGSTTDSVIAVALAARDFGIGTVAAQRAFHVITTGYGDTLKRVVAPSCHTLVAICLRSPQCEYFRPVEFSAERATWATKRRGNPEFKRTWVIADAIRAGCLVRWNDGEILPSKYDNFKKCHVKSYDSAWAKWLPNMLSSKASSELARMVFPEEILGMYSAEEFDGVDEPAMETLVVDAGRVEAAPVHEGTVEPETETEPGPETEP